MQIIWHTVAHNNITHVIAFIKFSLCTKSSKTKLFSVNTRHLLVNFHWTNVEANQSIIKPSKQGSWVFNIVVRWKMKQLFNCTTPLVSIIWPLSRLLIQLHVTSYQLSVISFQLCFSISFVNTNPQLSLKFDVQAVDGQYVRHCISVKFTKLLHVRAQCLVYIYLQFALCSSAQ